MSQRCPGSPSWSAKWSGRGRDAGGQPLKWRRHRVSRSTPSTTMSERQGPAKSPAVRDLYAFKSTASSRAAACRELRSERLPAELNDALLHFAALSNFAELHDADPRLIEY